MRHTKEKGGGRREKVSVLLQKTLRSACGGVELKYDGVPLRRIVVESRIVGRHYARPDFGHTFVSLFPFLRALYSAFQSPHRPLHGLNCLVCLSSLRGCSLCRSFILKLGCITGAIYLRNYQPRNSIL